MSLRKSSTNILGANRSKKCVSNISDMYECYINKSPFFNKETSVKSSERKSQTSINIGWDEIKQSKGRLQLKPDTSSLTQKNSSSLLSHSKSALGGTEKCNKLNSSTIYSGIIDKSSFNESFHDKTIDQFYISAEHNRHAYVPPGKRRSQKGKCSPNRKEGKTNLLNNYLKEPRSSVQSNNMNKRSTSVRKDFSIIDGQTRKYEADHDRRTEVYRSTTALRRDKSGRLGMHKADSYKGGLNKSSCQGKLNRTEIIDNNVDVENYQHSENCLSTSFNTAPQNELRKQVCHGGYATTHGSTQKAKHTEGMIFSANNSYIHNISITNPNMIISSQIPPITNEIEKDDAVKVEPNSSRDKDIELYCRAERIKKEICNNNSLSSIKKHQAIQESFNTIIKEDKYFGNVLNLIKSHYEEEIIDIKSISETFKRENMKLKTKIGKLFDENTEKQKTNSMQSKELKEKTKYAENQKTMIGELKKQLANFKSEINELKESTNKHENKKEMKGEINLVYEENDRLSKIIGNLNIELKKSKMKEEMLVNMLTKTPEGGKMKNYGSNNESVNRSMINLQPRKNIKESLKESENIDPMKILHLRDSTKGFNNLSCTNTSNYHSTKSKPSIPKLDLSKVKQNYKDAKIIIKQVTNPNLLLTDESDLDSVSQEPTIPKIMNESIIVNKEKNEKIKHPLIPRLDLSGIHKRRAEAQRKKKY